MNKPCTHQLTKQGDLWGYPTGGIWLTWCARCGAIKSSVDEVWNLPESLRVKEEPIDWREVFPCSAEYGHIGKIVVAALQAGKKYFEWNDSLYEIVETHDTLVTHSLGPFNEKVVRTCKRKDVCSRSDLPIGEDGLCRLCENEQRTDRWREDGTFDPPKPVLHTEENCPHHKQIEANKRQRQKDDESYERAMKKDKS